MSAARLAVAVLILSAGFQGAADAAPRRPRLGSVPAPLHLVPTTDEPTRIRGLDAYFGALRLDAAADGIAVVNHLSLERYLLGLQEVPLRWPEEALKAQAVAARTYALYTLGQPAAGAAATYGFDICASVECQVFAGADVVRGSNGDRWWRAVTETAGTTIVYDDQPILSRYHSTSGGRTLANERVFTDEPAYPYLKGVLSTTETTSPLYRWTVYLRLDRLQSMLRAAGRWDRSDGPLREVRSVESRAGLHYPDIALRGPRGRARVTAEELRGLLRDLAPSFYPDLYPSPWTTTSGVLPETLPSNRYEVRTDRGTAIVEGRGWGHGVGMSQWGAYGMAQAGASYEEILTHYYTGIELDRRDTDARIDVGIDWARTDLAARGAFALIDGRGRALTGEAIGTWKFEWLGEGRLAIDPPGGIRRPLRVEIVRAPGTATAGQQALLGIELSRPARVGTITEGGSEAGPAIRGSGTSRLAWVAPDRPGRYRVFVEAAVGSRKSRSEAVTVRVVPERSGAADAPVDGSEDEGGRGPIRILLAVFLVIILAATLRAGRIRG
jgi:SpoIID/LytB domain protein